MSKNNKKAAEEAPKMKYYFDEFQRHFDGKDAVYDPEFFDELIECFGKFGDDKLLIA